MTHEAFRRLALALAGTVESSHMGHPDFRISNKIFASLHAGLESGMVKLTAEQQQEFIGSDPKSFSPEAGAWGRAGCTRVDLASVTEDQLGEALTLAWKNIAAKKPAPAPKRKPTSRVRKSKPQG